MTLRRRLLWASALVLVAVPSACTRVGVPVGAGPRPQESEPTVAQPALLGYTGIATLSGRRVPVVLEVRTGTNGDVSAELRIPDLEMEAAGTGAWKGTHLTLELAYDDACPGTVRLEVEQDPRGRLAGTLRARDCTGEAEGPVALEAREERTSKGTSR